MDVTIISPEIEISVIMIGLLLLGLVGYLITRRWQKAIIGLLPVALYAAWELAVWVIGAGQEELPERLSWYRVAEIVIVGIVVLVGVGLPLLGMRRSRSRPAV